jgi:trehalose 6-phosphate phosphatase
VNFDFGRLPPVLPPDRTALFLDIDGTLLDYHHRPDSIEVDAQLLDLLVAAYDRLGGAVAFVTGRTIGQVDRLFAPLRLPMAGIFGHELRLTRSGETECIVIPGALTELADAIDARFGHVEGILVERKGPVLAIHTRAAPQMLEDIRQAVVLALRRFPENYEVLVGNAGLEVMPAGTLKSVAIERFMSVEPFCRRTPVFIGDDTSDESGFGFVNGIGGVSVRVFPNGPTQARYALKDVASTRRWLASLVGQHAPAQA